MIERHTCPMCGHVQIQVLNPDGCHVEQDRCDGCGSGCASLRCARCGYALVDTSRSSLARGWKKLVARFLGGTST